ncbi:MAG: DUF1553 domain-containing protein [Cyclobacteriaceae bacterium]
MRLERILIYLFAIVLLNSCRPELPEEVLASYENLPQELDFNIHVKPIISDKCFACHGPDKDKIEAGLQLHEASTAFSELPESPGKFAIVPGKLKKSEMFHRIMSQDDSDRMPPPEFNVNLTEYEKAILVKWIEDGAEYKNHWAFDKPQKPDLPKVKNKDWITNEIDCFVLNRLEREKLTPNDEASKEHLIRRVSLDLTGLPPTLKEINDFVNDQSENAYEKLVDRLIASPHYGERMAAEWMDLSRYADTYGYQVDRFRDMSPWRDWVIKSFNDNTPYDQFITWQVAGDLLPESNREKLIATGFNRLHPQNMEGGIVDEEFRVEYVSDRTNVVGTGFMALTLGCAKCHDHKYDPIAQKDYFELYSFFNNQNETGQISWDPEDTPVPNIKIPTEEEEKVLAYLREKVAEQESIIETVKVNSATSFDTWLKNKSYQSISQNTSKRGLTGHFSLNSTLRNHAASSQVAKMDRQFSKNEVPTYTSGYKGKGLLMNGDAWMDADPVGIFKRDQPFSIGLWLTIPPELKEGVIFHKNKGTRLHSYKGYHLNMINGKLEVMLAHTWPDNAIVKISTETIPRDEWFHIMMTYDGSSKAKGVKLFLNGEELETEVIHDNLYDDIIYHNLVDQIYDKPVEPGLQIGARWRGKGIKNAKVDELLVYDRELSQIEIMAMAESDAFKALQNTALAELSATQKSLLKDYFIKNQCSTCQKETKNLMMARRALVDSVSQVKEFMVMKEMETPRQAYVLERGQYDALGEPVYPNTPKKILPWKEEYPKNRLGLAQWMTDPDHPLTARVAVNRFWQQFFGRGIVKTSNDFGNQGELPTHPALLDWIAVTFLESEWNVKEMQKRIVMSSTYRQSSIASDEKRAKDPENILLACGPKSRMTSEMLRDNALAASGLLNKEIGGKSVKPYQPDGIWSMNADTYVQDHGEDLYRRSLYVYWKRTVPYPTLATFDQPERVECNMFRQKTNTPLQSLVMLNDPVYLETAKVLGEQMTKASDSESGIRMAYQKLTGLTPKDEELSLLIELQQTEYEKFKSDSSKAKGWLNAGEYEIDQSLDTLLVAANSIVASAIMNSDATITKR